MFYVTNMYIDIIFLDKHIPIMKDISQNLLLQPWL